MHTLSARVLSNLLKGTGEARRTDAGHNIHRHDDGSAHTPYAESTALGILMMQVVPFLPLMEKLPFIC